MTSALPAHPPAVDPVRRSRTTGTTWTVGLGVGALVCVLLVPIAGFLLWLYGGPDIDEARAAAEQFLQHVEAGDDGAAYQSLCATTRQRITAEAFTAAVERPARPASHTVTDSAFLNEPGTRAAVDVRLTDRAGAMRTISLRLDVTAGGWQVCDDTFG